MACRVRGPSRVGHRSATQDLAAASCYDGTGVARIDPSRARSGRRKVVIYYSDTGGGHRASATALRAALERHCDGDVEVEMTDFIRVACSRPFTWSPECYQHLGSFPSMYKWLYDETGDGDTGWAGTRTYEVVKRPMGGGRGGEARPRRRARMRGVCPGRSHLEVGRASLER